MIASLHRAIIFTMVVAASTLVYAQNSPSLPRIAHAGGQINNQTYTNSLEALNANYENGFRVFEIDFSWTSDQQLVCLHDWEQSFERSFGLAPQAAVSLQEFEQLVRERSEFSKCTLASLMQWFSEHPDGILVTDVKERNIEALEHISSNYPQFLARVIPQIYQPSEYAVARSLGYERIIWTLYLYQGSSLAVLEAAQSMDLWAITMDTTRAERDLGQNLDGINMPSYVHTINDIADFLYFKSLGIDEIYTDNLSREREESLIASGSAEISDSSLFQARAAKSQEVLRRLNQFFSKPRVHYSLEKDFSLACISSNQVAFGISHPDRLNFVATGNDPYISFPSFSDTVTQIELYARLNVPDGSSVEVFYTTQAQVNFTAELRESVQTTRGSNEVVISIEASSPITRIRLDPGAVPGEYSIERLEVRSN